MLDLNGSVNIDTSIKIKHVYLFMIKSVVGATPSTISDVYLMQNRFQVTLIVLKVVLDF